jgi:hypothetical protein
MHHHHTHPDPTLPSPAPHTPAHPTMCPLSPVFSSPVLISGGVSDELTSCHHIGQYLVGVSSAREPWHLHAACPEPSALLRESVLWQLPCACDAPPLLLPHHLLQPSLHDLLREPSPSSMGCVSALGGAWVAARSMSHPRRAPSHAWHALPSANCHRGERARPGARAARRTRGGLQYGQIYEDGARGTRHKGMRMVHEAAAGRTDDGAAPIRQRWKRHHHHHHQQE